LREAFNGFSAYVGIMSNIPEYEFIWEQTKGGLNSRFTKTNNKIRYHFNEQKFSRVKMFGNALSIANMGLLGYDIGITGEIKGSQWVDIGIITASCFIVSPIGFAIVAVVAGLWFIADVGMGYVTGKSFSDRLDESVKPMKLKFWEIEK